MKESTIDSLCKKYMPLSVEERFRELVCDFDANRILCTSSFGSSSLFLLNYISKLAPRQKVHFIDTGNHFTETLQYRDRLSEILHLDSHALTAPREIHRYTRRNETWKSNTRYCCFLKKVSPLEKVSPDYDVWISGLMEWQSDHRASLKIFENRNGMLRFYPLLDKTKKEFNDFLAKTDLPKHPLTERGYDSIGCIHCTRRGIDRMGRWYGTKHTECGLHL